MSKKVLIKPITILRDTNKISEICFKENQPIYITKNGENHLVIMSDDTFNNILSKDNEAAKITYTASNNLIAENKNPNPLSIPNNTSDNYGFTRIGLHVFEESIADIKKNTESIIEEIKNGIKNKEKIIVFPELCLTSYTCGDIFYQELLLQNIDSALLKIAEEFKHQKRLIIIGTPYRIKGKLYNVAAVINKGHILALIPKTYLPNYHEFYEKRQFTSGRDLNTLIPIGKDLVRVSKNIIFTSTTTSSISVGIEICEDLWSANPPSTKLALNGATIICNLSASNELVGKNTYRKELVNSTSARLNCIYAYVSAGNGESTQDVVYSGSALISENGALLKEKELYQNGSIYSDVDTEKIIKERHFNTSFETENEYENIPVEIDDEDLIERYFSPHPFLPRSDSALQEILDIQINSLIRRIKQINCKAVIGVSGGLDSTLALIVSVEAMKKLNRPTTDVYSILLPAFGTSSRTKSNAQVLAESLNTTVEIIDIKDSVTKHLQDLNHPLNLMDTAYENAQARERTQVLMDKANMVNGIVIGTGDLSESCLGWSTYNGDHMSNYAINVSVPKTLVIDIIRYYAKTHEELYNVLKDIIDTPVSPELLPTTKDGKIAQKTEDLIGPYELHDFFIFHYLRNYFSPKKIFRLANIAFKDKYEPTIILKWEKAFFKRFFAMQFKRTCIPDGPKIGSVSISPRGDLRMPTDASSKMFLEELNESEKNLTE